MANIKINKRNISNFFALILTVSEIVTLHYYFTSKSLVNVTEYTICNDAIRWQMSKLMNVTIVRTGRTSAKIKKKVKRTFVDFDMVSLHKLYSVTLSYFLKVRHFKC